MSLDLTAFDDAVITRLKAQVGALRAVKTLDEVDDLLTSGEGTPSAWVLINGIRYQRRSGASQYQEGDITLVVYLKTRNARGQGAARKAANDGAYALVQATVTALLGYSPAPCGPLELVDVAALAVEKSRAIYAVRFSAATSEEY